MEEGAGAKCNGSGCGGENKEGKLQRIKSSLDFFVLLLMPFLFVFWNS
jgi:hypothetical protein